MIPNFHHLWCNGDPGRPVKGCQWCDKNGDGTVGLWASYPYTTNEEEGGLAKKHFPNAIERPGT